MSRVTFHSPHGEAELHGSEYYLLHHLADSMSSGYLGHDGDIRRVTELLDRPLYGGQGYHTIDGVAYPDAREFDLWWRVGGSFSMSHLGDDRRPRWEIHELARLA